MVIGRAKGGGQDLYLLVDMLHDPTNPSVSCVGIGDLNDSNEHIERLSDFLNELT